MDIHDFIRAIEPQQTTTVDAGLEETLVLLSVTSAAVSLKRIADALETLARNDTARTCFNGDGSPNTAELNVSASGGINVCVAG